MEKYYTPEQVAEIFLVQPRTVRSWLRDGELIGDKVSNQWRISHKSVQDFKTKNSKEEQFTIIELAKILNVEEAVVTAWLINGNLKGEKMRESWQVTKDNLKKAFPESDFTFGDFFSVEEMNQKLVSQIPEPEKAFKALYPEEYDAYQEQERQRNITALDRFRNKCQEDLDRRFPYDLGGLPAHVASAPLLWIQSFYEQKYNEESTKIDRLAQRLKEKYGVPEEDLAEVKRTYENLQLLKIGSLMSDVSHL